ncbi:nucleoside triphosphate pyrophosphohydrolase [Nocardioides sp. GY 10113]|uniref:MazG nucleotide pyrophosphohydrolase domain-containing protein n=1 Tax=Nocardioides sp. GY 10113 TaxID=2569761 RepID=UPI0010A84CBD|nr:MazG nucleotide pyrophosphohydrolase domain-containing protein [Nocardioides sp. GY 10113]TIC87554.1 nucleoside triphosphate pyrophosphohydrolase [Nocardioides sp. GY 10113]
MPGAPEGEGPAGGSGDALAEFVTVMRRLRAECPWKQEQTHRSLQRYLVEETYETLEAIDVGAASGEWRHLREELGDLLLQVVFHAVIAEEGGEFDLEQVARGITAKMIRRNPHVFGAGARGETAGELDADAVNDLWQEAKAAEKGATSPSPLPPGLPALLYADKTLDRWERAGRPVEIDPESPELGERLLALAVEARAAGVDAEQALRDAVRRRG